MNKNIKYTLAAMVFACWGNAMAQNPYGAYFMDGYAFGHQMTAADISPLRSRAIPTSH